LLLAIAIAGGIGVRSLVGKPKFLTHQTQYDYGVTNGMTAATPPPNVRPRTVPGLNSGVSSVSAGGYHNCALLDTGELRCWGHNYYGQLGTGNTADSDLPVNALGLSPNIQQVSSGGNHTCALLNSGKLKCWGFNLAGQLGDGTTGDKHVPTDVTGMSSGVKMVSAGGYHTCALMNSGSIRCWGRNKDGQLGDGTTVSQIAPTDVVSYITNLPPAKKVTTGIYHTCALFNDGGVKCWGDNFHGELGNGSTGDQALPVDVQGLTSGVADISARGGWHTCALMNSGSVKCWGWNGFGQLGDGTTADQSLPADVKGIFSDVLKLSTGGYHTCALLSDKVKCWGQNNWGQLSDGTYLQRNTPVDVKNLGSDVKFVSCGGFGMSVATDQTCVIMNNGGVKCWGFQ